MFFDIAHIQVTMLQQHIGNHLLLCGQPKKSEADHEKVLKELADPH